MSKFSNNAPLLRKIDALVGVSLCAILTFFRGIDDLLFRRNVPKIPRRILFIKLAEQGSTVLAYEAIRRAVERVGPENVYFFLFEENRFILDLLDLVPPDNVLIVRTESLFSMVTSCIEQLLHIRTIGVDTCIDMEFFVRSTAIISWLSGASIRVGLHAYFGEGPYRGNLFTHRVLYNHYLHASSTFTSLVMALDMDPEKFPTFAVSPPVTVAPPLFDPDFEEIGEVKALLNSIDSCDSTKLVLLNANASDLMPYRRWNEANYVVLAKRLLKELPEICIGFTGGPDEAKKIEGLVSQVGSERCFCLAGKTTLRQLLIIYNLAEILVTNDSGPAHFSTLTSVDVVTLFGPETPLLFGAPTPRNHVLWAGVACSPCVNAYNNRQSACTNNLCMKMITVEQVFETVCSVYRQRQLQPA